MCSYVESAGEYSIDVKEKANIIKWIEYLWNNFEYTSLGIFGVSMKKK